MALHCFAARCRRPACCAPRAAAMRCSAQPARRGFRASARRARCVRCLRLRPGSAAHASPDLRPGMPPVPPGSMPSPSITCCRRSSTQARSRWPSRWPRRCAPRSRRAGRRCPDCLVAIPLSPQRQQARGFNHAREIARRVATQLGVPLADGLLRTRDTPPQAALRLAQRAANLRGAFDARGGFAARSVAIVDDVMTTGATLAAAAQALRAAGALRVEAWAVARTLPPGPAAMPPRN